MFKNLWGSSHKLSHSPFTKIWGRDSFHIKSHTWPKLLGFFSKKKNNILNYSSINKETEQKILKQSTSSEIDEGFRFSLTNVTKWSSGSFDMVGLFPKLWEWMSQLTLAILFPETGILGRVLPLNWVFSLFTFGIKWEFNVNKASNSTWKLTEVI